MANCVPAVSTSHLEEDLVVTWLKENTSSAEWCKRFVTAQAVNVFTTHKQIEERVEFMDRAEGMKTP